jgi:C-terminal processing protease CtpA/Prc
MDGLFGLFCAPNKGIPDLCGCTRESERDVMTTVSNPSPKPKAESLGSERANPNRNKSSGPLNTSELRNSYAGAYQAVNPEKKSSYGTTAPAGHCMAGIGAAFESGEGIGLLVHSLVVGGPAESCGLIRKGDELIAVDGTNVCGMGAKELAQVLIGPVGTSVRVSFVRTVPGSATRQPINVELIRKQSCVSGWPVSSQLADVRMPGWSRYS